MSLNIQLETGYQQIAGNGKPAAESVLYYTTKATFPVTGESEKLYVDKSTGEIFTWNTSLTKYIASGITSADGISYDNTSSGLTAEVIQDAIDETVAKINDIQLFKFPNATIIGAPTINNGQVSGFSATNYMKFPFIVNMQGRPFTIDIAFTTGTDITNQQNIIDGIDHGIAFAIRSGKFILVLGSKTGEWDISGGEKVSSVAVQSQTTYLVRISWDGSVYKFEYSTNGETYTEDTTMRVSSSLSLFPTQINIGVTSGLGGIFSGIINMNYCSLTISNKVVWTGMDDVGLATRMAVDMSNIDEAGIEKVKSIIGDLPTKESLGLDNVTNDKQVKGLSTGTTAGHLVSWGSDGYTVADTGAKIISADINAEENKDNIPTAQLVLDSFTKKVTTEAVDNDTRIITVPEDVDCFAGIGMIGGKTVKRSNLWDEQYTNGNYTSDGNPTSSSNHIRNSNPIPVKPNYTYTMVTTSDTYRTVFWTKDMELVSTTGGITDRVFIVPENAYFMGFNMDSVYGGVYKNDIAIYEGKIENAVYGMERLDNAPVTAVESIGKNIFDYEAFVAEDTSTRKVTGINQFSVSGTYFQSYNIKLKPNTRYIVYVENMTGSVNSGVIVRVNGSSNNLYAKYINGYGAFTTASETDYRIGFYSGNTTYGTSTYKNVMVYEGRTNDIYVPYSKITISLETIINNLPDYGCSVGDVYNYIDFEEMKYHHRVGNIAMKDHLPSSWSYIEASKRYVSDYWASTINLKIPLTSSTLAGIVTNNYSISEWVNVADSSKDKTIYISTSGGICVRNLAATTAAQLNNLLQDTVLNYELAEEELIPLSSIIPPIHVEPNGTIEFVNEHNLDVPSKIIYKKTI